MNKEISENTENTTSLNGDSIFFQNEDNINSEINKITLEFMCNKKKYNKIIEKTDPQKFEEQQLYLIKLKKYSHMLIPLTKELIESPYKEITHDIQKSFNDYVSSCIRYFEMLEVSKKNYLENDKMNDEDTLFDNMIELEKTWIPNNNSQNISIDETGEDIDDLNDSARGSIIYSNNSAGGSIVLPNYILSNSYWGKSIKKISS